MLHNFHYSDSELGGSLSFVIVDFTFASLHSKLYSCLLNSQVVYDEMQFFKIFLSYIFIKLLSFSLYVEILFLLKL